MRTKIFFVLFTGVLFMTSGAGGCDDGCGPESFRCNGSTLEICSSDGTWMQHTECADVYSPALGTPFACCYASDGGVEPECLPPAECE